MLAIDYRELDQCAVLSWTNNAEELPWRNMVCRLVADRAEGAVRENAHRISVPWWSLVSLRAELRAVFAAHGLSVGRGIELGETASRLLRQSTAAATDYGNATHPIAADRHAINDRLAAIGFFRALSEEQQDNVARIAPLRAAAIFSTRGTGKTTEALALFFSRATPQEVLLVVVPAAGFDVWAEQLAECMPLLDDKFVRIRGDLEAVERALRGNPRFAITTYQQLARIPDVFGRYCARRRVHLFLDESHRIKSGAGKQTARATLGLSHLPVAKLIMSGTPMPQSVEDLVPQFAFLYPEIPANADTVVDLMRPVYVRTNKAQLGLPPITLNLVSLPMAPMQQELYKLMKFEVAREAANALSIGGKQAFRSLGRSVARLLQFVSNPALLSSHLEIANADLLAAVLSEGDGPKLKYVLKRARLLAKSGQKVLIWSSFVRNVEYVAERLADLGAVYIHGGVDAGDEEDDESREGKIRLFHDDPNVRLMIANPAAASEGISLHRICHHAIYLDRTFNAAHYLQSQDRIHRFGLPPDQKTTIEIVECINSVDETVRARLDLKVGTMAQALADSSLRPDPIPIDPCDIEDFDEYSTGLSVDDIKALLTNLSGRVR